MSLASEPWWKKLGIWLAKEIGRAVLSPVTVLVTAFVGSAVLPALFLRVKVGAQFFASGHSVPGWTISLALTACLFLLVVAVWQRAAIRRARPQKERTFLYGGMDWVLTSDFQSNWRHLMLADMAPIFLRSLVRGPFCRKCKIDLAGSHGSDGLLPQVCPRCGTRFHPSGPTDSFESRRRLIYMEAQAAARRDGL